MVKSGKNWGTVGKKVCTEQTRCHHGGARSLHEEHRGSKEITRRCNSVVILTNSLAYQRIFSHHEMYTRSPEMQGANKEITRWYTVIVRHSTVQHGVLHFRLRVAIAQPFRDSVTRALEFAYSKNNSPVHLTLDNVISIMSLYRKTDED